jgi:hypothetical protein
MKVNQIFYIVEHSLVYMLIFTGKVHLILLWPPAVVHNSKVNPEASENVEHGKQSEAHIGSDLKVLDAQSVSHVAVV